MKGFARRTILLLWVALRSHAEPTDAISQLARSEPTIEALRAAAVRASGAKTISSASWARRARAAGLVPTLTLRVLRALGRGEDLRQSATTSDALKLAVDNDLVLEARATWDFARLVFDPSELRASREHARRFSEQVDLESEVTRLYYQRRRAQMEMLLRTPSDPTECWQRELEIAELTSYLDALTGGALSGSTP